MSLLKKRKLNGYAPSAETGASRTKVQKRSMPVASKSIPTATKSAPKTTTKSAPHEQDVESNSSNEEDEEEARGSNESEVESGDEEVGQAARKAFADLGVREELCEACDSLGYKHPTPIQEQSIPIALSGRDVLVYPTLDI